MNNAFEYTEFLTRPRGEATKYTDVAQATRGLARPQTAEKSTLIEVPEGAVQTIRLDGVRSDIAIKIGAYAHVKLIDDCCGAEKTWSCRRVEILLGPGSTCDHRQTITGTGVQTLAYDVRVANKGSYLCSHLNTSAGLTRQDLHVVLQTDGVADLRAAQLLRNQSHHDLTVSFKHLSPVATSRQQVRNIVMDNARGVYQGKIYVDQAAQKTDASQQCKTILMSNMAEMDVKPELEIYADDVQCAHGSSCGAIDADQLFYMMARGIDESAARSLLLRGFVVGLFEESDRKWVDGYLPLVDRWLMEKNA